MSIQFRNPVNIFDIVQPVSRRSIAALGDSITANSLSSTATSLTWTPTGYLTWVNILSRQRFYCPPANMLGVSGNSTSQMLARIPDVLAAAPDICIVHGGTNDLPVVTSASAITANLSAIYDALIEAGILVIAVPILASTSGARSALTTAQINTGLSVNNWIKSLSRKVGQKSLIVVDCGLAIGDPTSTVWAPRSGYTVDGLHPNGVGAYTIGKRIVDALNIIFPDWYYPVTSPADVYDATYATNGNLLPGGMFTGTGGTLSGLSGTLADGWAASVSSIGGATVAGSSVTLSDGRSAQQMDISGTFSGSSRKLTIFKALSTTPFVAGDTLEAQIEFNIAASSQNIQDLYLVFQSTEGGVTYNYGCGGGGQAWPTTDAINGVLSTPPRTLTANPSAIAVFAYIDFVNQASSSPIAATVKWSSASLRKV